MIANDGTSIDREEQIDFAAVWQVIWDHKYIIFFTTVAAGLIAVYFALTIPPIYRAETTVIEVREGKLGGVESLAGPLGGLANIAGLNLGGGGEGQQAQAVLGSRHLVEEFIQRKHLLPELSAPSGEPLTLWLAVAKFQKNVLSIRQDRRTGLTTVAMNWTDPAKAALWANEFVALANELIRARVMDDSARNIDYLKDQIARTNVVEMQRAMYNLIESETKTLMLANGRAEYAFTVIDPGVQPEVRISPRRTLIVLVSVALGGGIGLVVAFLLNLRHRGRASSGQQR